MWRTIITTVECAHINMPGSVVSVRQAGYCPRDLCTRPLEVTAFPCNWCQKWDDREAIGCAPSVLHCSRDPWDVWTLVWGTTVIGTRTGIHRMQKHGVGDAQGMPVGWLQSLHKRFYTPWTQGFPCCRIVTVLTRSKLLVRVITKDSN